jgi:hypothetical protein
MSKQSKKKKIDVVLEEQVEGKISEETDEEFNSMEKLAINKFTNILKDRSKYALSGVFVGSFMSPMNALIIIVLFCVLTGNSHFITDLLVFLWKFGCSAYLNTIKKNSKKN